MTGEPLDPLTKRELEIFQLLADGLKDKEIGERLFLSTGTVKWHVKNIYSKLDAPNRTSAVAKARAWGLLGPVVDEPMPQPARPRHNLQSQTTTFIGRETDVNSTLSLLTNDNCRLITLVGVGGIGKTRLAIECAGRLIDTFADGVYYVNFDTSTANLLPSALADVLNFRTVGRDDLRAQLLRMLRNKKLLLILDSFEHLIDEASFVVQILNSAADVKIIVTSREVLNVREEWIYPVEGLSYPGDIATENIEPFGAIKLFVDRASRVRNDFSVTAERPWLIQICQAVGGMPLAIELLTTWLNVLSCEEIAHGLGRDRDMVAADGGDLPERQQSIHTVFAQSWELLSSEEQSIFMKAGVFRGGFTRAAAERVTGASLRNLAALVNKSLISANKQGRHGLHLLLRHYAEGKLNALPPIEHETRLLHSRYYARVLVDVPPAEADRVWLDVDNIWAGMAYAIGERQLEDIGQYVRGLWQHFERRGWYLVEGSILKLYQDSITVFEQAIANGEYANPDANMLREVHESLANLLYSALRYSEARPAYQAALAYAVKVDNPVVEARLYRKIASTYAAQRTEIGTMFDTYQQAESALGEVGSDDQAEWWNEWIQIKLDLVWGYYSRNDIASMTRLLEEVEKPVQARGSHAQKSKLYFNRGLISLRQHMFHHLPAQSVRDAKMAVEEALKSGELREIGLVEMSVGYAHLWRDEMDDAEIWFMSSLERARQSGDVMGSQSTVLTYIPLIHRRRQQVDLSEYWAQEGLKAATEAHSPFYIGTSLGNLGWVAYRRGKLDEAKAYCEKAVQTWAAISVTVPMEWMARIPLLAVLLHENAVGQAIDNARILIDPKQKILHDPLPALLAEAIEAWDAHDVESAVEALHAFCERCPALGYL